jgi:ATP-dependent exoDNAse (exonuclease V) beta subunit
MLLADNNRHPRDARLHFEEKEHIYTLDGEHTCVSVTTLIHRYFPHFDADKVIAKMMRAPSWPTSKYYGKTADEIKSEWERAGSEASAAGTKMHHAIEMYYNGDDSFVRAAEASGAGDPEMKHFRAFLNDYGHLTPYRTEWMVFDEDKRVAGSIDMVFEDPTQPGALMIFDWKRSKEIKMFNPWQSGTGPLASLSDCNFVHYSLQLNTYKHILEEKYGKVVTDLRLVILHPNNDTYQVLTVPDMNPYVRKIFSEL